MNVFAKSNTKVDLDTFCQVTEWHWDIFYQLVDLNGYDKPVLCKKCGKVTKYYLKNLHLVLKCPPPCQHTYSPTADTIFSNSKLYLPAWMYAIYLIDGNPKITLNELQRQLKCTNVTACNIRRKIKTLKPRSVERKLYNMNYGRLLSNL